MDAAPRRVPLHVVVRVRPRLARDGKFGTDTSVVGATAVLVSGSIEPFAFSCAFGPEATQHAIYNECAASQVAAVLNGYDACIFAFGQTGAGKTYSMLGPAGGHSPTQDGIIPLAAAELFRSVARLEADEPGCQHRLSASFVEIHREGVFDLLSPDRIPLAVYARPVVIQPRANKRAESSRFAMARVAVRTHLDAEQGRPPHRLAHISILA